MEEHNEFFLLMIIGISSGTLVAGGLCSLITTIGILNRLAFKTKTVKWIHLYEKLIFWSAITCIYAYLCMPNLHMRGMAAFLPLAVVGLFMGIFVGCLAMSLTEALDASAILFRRIHLSTGTKYIILAAALGKLVGKAVYFLY